MSVTSTSTTSFYSFNFWTITTLLLLVTFLSILYWLYYHGVEYLAHAIHLEMSTWRLQANKRPLRIFLIRHGESQGNIDKNLYETIPDNKIELTERGRQQALAAGRELKQIIGDQSVLFLVSPFKRSRQTYELIEQSFNENTHRMREDPRIREQEWGNFQSSAQMANILAEREVVGRFFYRFPDGESGADVFDRVSSFMESLFREIDTQSPVQNIVIVSHGLFIRLFLMRFFRWTVEKFNAIWNFENCEYALLEKDPDSGSYELKTELRMNQEFTSTVCSKNNQLNPPPNGSLPSTSTTPVTSSSSPATCSPGSFQRMALEKAKDLECTVEEAKLEGRPIPSGMELIEEVEDMERRARASSSVGKAPTAAVASETNPPINLSSHSPPRPVQPKPCKIAMNASPTSPSSNTSSTASSISTLHLPHSFISTTYARKIPSPMESVYDSSFALVETSHTPPIKSSSSSSPPSAASCPLTSATFLLTSTITATSACEQEEDVDAFSPEPVISAPTSPKQRQRRTSQRAE